MKRATEPSLISAGVCSPHPRFRITFSFSLLWKMPFFPKKKNAQSFSGKVVSLVQVERVLSEGGGSLNFRLWVSPTRSSSSPPLPYLQSGAPWKLAATDTFPYTGTHTHTQDNTLGWRLFVVQSILKKKNHFQNKTTHYFSESFAMQRFPDYSPLIYLVPYIFRNFSSVHRASSSACVCPPVCVSAQELCHTRKRKTSSSFRPLKKKKNPTFVCRLKMANISEKETFLGRRSGGGITHRQTDRFYWAKSIFCALNLGKERFSNDM